mmetsp:Transcript_120380/g.236618  ORF Transcript_120380/g.236618 Transcript_120380/m.236618 type:complete len:278 (+) Transcript_120380:694-1527(+)
MPMLSSASSPRSTSMRAIRPWSTSTLGASGSLPLRTCSVSPSPMARNTNVQLPTLMLSRTGETPASGPTPGRFCMSIIRRLMKSSRSSTGSSPFLPRTSTWKVGSHSSFVRKRCCSLFDSYTAKSVWRLNLKAQLSGATISEVKPSSLAKTSEYNRGLLSSDSVLLTFFACIASSGPSLHRSSSSSMTCCGLLRAFSREVPRRTSAMSFAFASKPKDDGICSKRWLPPVASGSTKRRQPAHWLVPRADPSSSDAAAGPSSWAEGRRRTAAQNGRVSA